MPRSVSVFGAAGFTGALAARLLLRHPTFELRALTARSDQGRRLDDLYPHHRVPIELVELLADPLPGCLLRLFLQKLTDWRPLGAESAVQIAADGDEALAADKLAERTHVKNGVNYS